LDLMQKICTKVMIKVFREIDKTSPRERKRK